MGLQYSIWDYFTRSSEPRMLAGQEVFLGAKAAKKGPCSSKASLSYSAVEIVEPSSAFAQGRASWSISLERVQSHGSLKTRLLFKHTTSPQTPLAILDSPRVSCGTLSSKWRCLNDGLQWLLLECGQVPNF